MPAVGDNGEGSLEAYFGGCDDCLWKVIGESDLSSTAPRHQEFETHKADLFICRSALQQVSRGLSPGSREDYAFSSSFFRASR